MYTEKKRLGQRLVYRKQESTALLSAYVSPVSALPPCTQSTACHQCSPPLFRPCCGWCSAWPCDEREGHSDIFNATSLTHPLHSIMSARISIVPAQIILFLWWLCWPCNLSTAALSSARLDLIQQHLQDYIWQPSALNFPPALQRDIQEWVARR